MFEKFIRVFLYFSNKSQLKGKKVNTFKVERAMVEIEFKMKN